LVTAGISSLSILIDWLSKEQNYNKWKGGNEKSGVPKGVIANKILACIIDAGISTELTAKYRWSKLSGIVRQLREAIHWLNGKGAGLTCEQSLEVAVKKSCRY